MKSEAYAKNGGVFEIFGKTRSKFFNAQTRQKSHVLATDRITMIGN